MKLYKLKPCPFCGGEGRVWIGGRGPYQATVGCTACPARLMQSFKSGQAAADAWNARAGEKEADHEQA